MNDEGFTLVETLVSLFVFLTAVIMVWGFSFTLGSYFLKASANAKEAEKTLQFDTVFRAAVARITVPFWEGKALTVDDPYHLIIPWVDGIEDKKMEIHYSEKTLRINTGDIEFILNDTDAFRAENLKDSSGLLTGIRIIYSRSGKEYVSASMFHAWPLVSGM
jgi:hypothetical protein